MTSPPGDCHQPASPSKPSAPVMGPIVYLLMRRPSRASSRASKGPLSPPTETVPVLSMMATESQRSPPVTSLKRARGSCAHAAKSNAKGKRRLADIVVEKYAPISTSVKRDEQDRKSSRDPSAHFPAAAGDHRHHRSARRRVDGQRVGERARPAGGRALLPPPFAGQGGAADRIARY